MLDHFFPLLFPKNSESLKLFDIRLREVGAKRPLNGTSKVKRHTNRHTNRQTDRRTFRLIESIGPEGRCFENVFRNNFGPRKCPNQKMHESESAGYLVWALPEVQNRFWKQFLLKVLYNYYSKKIEVFRLKKWRSKKFISYCILKMGFDHGRVTFLTIKKTKQKINFLKYA